MSSGQTQKRGQSGCQQSLHTCLNWKYYSRSDIYTLFYHISPKWTFFKGPVRSVKVSIACWQIVLSSQFWGIRKMWKEIHLVRQEIKNIGTFYEKWENLIKMPRNFIWFVLSTNDDIIKCRHITKTGFLSSRQPWKMEKPDKIAKKFDLIFAKTIPWGLQKL